MYKITITKVEDNPDYANQLKAWEEAIETLLYGFNKLEIKNPYASRLILVHIILDKFNAKLTELKKV